MKPAGGGIPRLAYLLLVSLLLHLAVIATIVGVTGREAEKHGPAQRLTVEYLESRAKQESRPEEAAPQPAKSEPRRAAPPKALSAVPSGAKQRPDTHPPAPPTHDARQGGSPLPKIIPLLPAEKGDAEMTVGTVGGTGRGGSGAGSGSGVGAGAARGGGTGGTHGGGVTPASSQGGVQRRAAYQALLRRLIEAHKEYPLAARKLRQEGSCQRRFTLRRDGSLAKVESLSSCGYTYLDDAATRAITTVGTFPPLPEEFTGAEAAFTIPITFTLSGK